MLKFEEDKLSWDFNIPRNVTFTFVNYNNCTICEKEEIRDWSAPYIVALVPHDRVVVLIKRYFDFTTTSEILANHQKHIRVEFKPDEEIIKEALSQLKSIQSDVTQQVDEKAVIESSIRGLFARKLQLEIKNEYGREYRDVINSLNKWVELKLKSKGDIDSTEGVGSLGDLIKTIVKGKENESVKPDTKPEQRITRSRTITRDGTKESIEYFVRGYSEDRYMQGSKLDIPHSGQQR